MHSESLRVKQWVKQQEKSCPICGKPMYYKSKTCKSCSPINRNKMNSIKQMTIGEYRKKILQTGKHTSWLHAEVRQLARSWNKQLRKLPCQTCGYTLHVELCHIKPLTSFSDDVALNIVNSESNIAVLCPNCHWEFDNGLLTIT